MGCCGEVENCNLSCSWPVVLYRILALCTLALLREANGIASRLYLSLSLSSHSSSDVTTVVTCDDVAAARRGTPSSLHELSRDQHCALMLICFMLLVVPALISWHAMYVCVSVLFMLSIVLCLHVGPLAIAIGWSLLDSLTRCACGKMPAS